MGGGYYDRDDSNTTSNNSVGITTTNSTSNSSNVNTSSSVVGKTSNMNPGLNPKRFVDNDSKLICTAGDPVVFALDVTGSMGEWTKIIYDKMPMFYGQIMMQKYLQNPSISFCAIGDAKTDQAPLQVSDFGQGKEIDQLIAKMWLEGNGGGNNHESYEMSGWFYEKYTQFTNARRPFFFVTGDEGFWENTTETMIEKVMGYNPNQSYNGKTTWQNLMKKFNVFHIKKKYTDANTEKIVKEQWCDALGPERVLYISNPKACVDTMLGAICLTSGARTLEEYVKDMKVREQTKERIAEVTFSLQPYSDALNSGKIKPVEATNEVLTKITRDFTSLKADVDSKILSSLTEDELIELYKGMKELSLSKKSDIPLDFICPITGELFFDPVISPDQHTYEKIAIELWFESNDDSPIDGKKLESKELIPNMVLKKLVRDFYTNNK